MRLFNDPNLAQALIDGGIHLNIIRTWLRNKGLHVLSESTITETTSSSGVYQLDTIPAILFHLKKATLKQPRAEILFVEVNRQKWPIDHEDEIVRILFQTWNAFARYN